MKSFEICGDKYDNIYVVIRFLKLLVLNIS